jgi:hypothetical protein
MKTLYSFTVLGRWLVTVLSRKSRTTGDLRYFWMVL